jgi:hypothetical protein
MQSRAALDHLSSVNVIRFSEHRLITARVASVKHFFPVLSGRHEQQGVRPRRIPRHLAHSAI